MPRLDCPSVSAETPKNVNPEPYTWLTPLSHPFLVSPREETKPQDGEWTSQARPLGVLSVFFSFAAIPALF